MSSRDGNERFRVVIAGGGVAALEGALALRELAGDRVSTTMLAPAPDFRYRPMSVREPFGYRGARRYALAELTNEIGVELRAEAFKWLDPAARIVHTESGERIPYDALLLALGARPYQRFRHAVTLDDRRLDEQLHGLIQDIEGGYVHELAFIVPDPMPWPLPVYELALMTAARATEMCVDLSITLITPEDAPLAIFGTPVNQAVQRLLDAHGIVTITGARCEIPAPGEVAVFPGARRLLVDRVIALPVLFGPSTPGIPKRSAQGFIPVDARCGVVGLERVFAAGDATDFAVKHGGVAAQQADLAAEEIAALAGAPVEPSRFDPVIRAILLGPERPLYMTARVTGAHGSRSEVSDHPTWSPPAKIAARYLGPFLASRELMQDSCDRAAVR